MTQTEEFYKARAERAIEVAKKYKKEAQEKEQAINDISEEKEQLEQALRQFTVKYNGGNRQLIDGFMKNLTEENIILRSACLGIENLAKGGSKFNFKMTMGLAIVIVAVVFMLLYSTQTGFQASINKNIIPLTVIVVAIAVIAIVIMKFKK